jgi:16S rRNA C967 or C1407 C5-methylase (RsmB/RsmF family)/NOL1/NOP2/fmu family ribosome biogenesis protein
MQTILPLDFVTNIGQIPQCDHQKLLDSLVAEAAISIRLNPHKKIDTAFSSALEPIPWCKEGYYLKERPVFTLDPLFHAGTYYVQEASSMIVGHAFSQLFPDSKNLRVLDSCAAPGGKSTHIASLLDESSLLVSNEIIRNRAMILSENIQKWGLSNVVVTNSDPQLFAKLPGYFDAVIIDAPCSGEGMFRKDETAVKDWSLANVANCVNRQKQIVSDLWDSLKENALLFYSTCTFNTKENEEIASWICTELGAESIKITIDDSWGITPVENLGIHSLRCFPYKCKGEGFSLMVLRKTATTQSYNAKKRRKSFFVDVPKTIESALKTYITKDDYSFVQNNAADIYTFHKSFESEIAMIGNVVKVVQAGTAVALVKGKDIIPNPAFAFSTIINKDTFAISEISKETALLYLSRGSFLLPDAEHGWQLLVYETIPLGFVKNLGNRINNSYPMEWRIRMNIK